MPMAAGGVSAGRVAPGNYAVSGVLRLRGLFQCQYRDTSNVLAEGILIAIGPAKGAFSD